MAAPFVSDKSSRNVERVCQTESSHQEQPNLNLPRAAAKKRVVGFDCEFVERPAKAFQVDCPVCLLVLREPHQVTCCGYSYCQPCIERVQFDKKPCPTCNTAEFSVFPNKGFQRSLYELRVCCSHEKDGCQWTGELGELDKHLNESPIVAMGRQFIGCEFTEIECNDCGKSFQRQHFRAHQLEQHPFSCEYCHYESYYEDVVKNHLLVCGFYPVPCPNECGVYPERQNLKHHVSNDCPLTVVNCDFHYAGCEVQLPRKDMPAHLADNLVPHMAQLATYNQKKVQEKDQQIMQLTEDLRQELEKNRQKIDWLERENEALSKSLLKKKNEIAQLQKDLNVKDKATAEEITKLREDTCVKEETLKQEIAGLRQAIAELRETSVSKEENEAMKQEVRKMVSKETTKQELTQLKAKQEENRSSLQTLQSYTVIPPVEFTMTEFKKHKQDNDIWYSEPFYTHPRGYKMCLRVEANGKESTHISVRCHLMRGEFDDHLRWPFSGDITVQLLNQVADKMHHTHTYSFSSANTSRVTIGEIAIHGYGFPKFHPHSELGHDAARNRQYLKDDCLRFRVTRVTNLT